MPLTFEQVAELKAQLKQQIQHMPEQQRVQAEAHIDAMSAQAIESMLQEQQARSAGPSGKKTIFRMIVDGDVESYKIADNADALAVLDINPISRGHILIIPKKAVSNVKDIPQGARALAEHLAKTLVNFLGAKKLDIIPDTKFNESHLHILPAYDTPLTLSSPRSSSSPEELQQLAESIKLHLEKPQPEKITQTKPRPTEFLKLPRRIP